MTIFAALVSTPVTLDQLVALSDELAALARAGVPLDRGLQELGQELPGRLGKLADKIGQRLEAGQPLDQIVAELGTSLPPAYRTVLTAGLRAGRLPAALEGVAQSARRISQLRKMIGLSLIYPVCVLLVAWVLLAFVLIKIMPVLVTVMSDVGLPAEPLSAIIFALRDTAIWWGAAGPLAFVGWLAWIWYRSGRVAAGVELHPVLGLGAVGTLARMQRAGRIASFADLLALLIAHEVPLAEAIELASGGIGSPSIERGGRELAQRLRRGETIDRPPPGFPPLITWTLAGGSSPGRLSQALARMAETYRNEVARRGQWLQLYVPLVMTLGVCGTVVTLYALLTLLPWIAVLHRLSQPM